MNDYVRYEQDGPIVTLTLNAPERRNAIPARLEQIWADSAASSRDQAAVADAMAQGLIGR